MAGLLALPQSFFSLLLHALFPFLIALSYFSLSTVLTRSVSFPLSPSLFSRSHSPFLFYFCPLSLFCPSISRFYVSLPLVSPFSTPLSSRNITALCGPSSHLLPPSIYLLTLLHPVISAPPPHPLFPSLPLSATCLACLASWDTLRLVTSSPVPPTARRSHDTNPLAAIGSWGRQVAIGGSASVYANV